MHNIEANKIVLEELGYSITVAPSLILPLYGVLVKLLSTSSPAAGGNSADRRIRWYRLRELKRRLYSAIEQRLERSLQTMEGVLSPRRGP